MKHFHYDDPKLYNNCLTFKIWRQSGLPRLVSNMPTAVKDRADIAILLVLAPC